MFSYSQLIYNFLKNMFHYYYEINRDKKRERNNRVRSDFRYLKRKHFLNCREIKML